MTDNTKRRHDPVFVRFGTLIVICCVSGLLLYCSVRWWSTWWFDASKEPAALWIRQHQFYYDPRRYNVEVEDGTWYIHYESLTLKEVLKLRDEDSTRTISVKGFGVVKQGVPPPFPYLDPTANDQSPPRNGGSP